MRTHQKPITSIETSAQVTANERADLAETIELAIMEIIDKAGYRNRHAVEAAHSAAKLVVNKVTERKVKP